MDSAVNSSSERVFHSCVSSVKSRIIFTAWFCVYLLFLPLFLFVLFIGFKKWKKRGSGSTSGTVSHSDVFTVHMVLMETASVLTAGVGCVGLNVGNDGVTNASGNVIVITTTGQVFFHSLTCVERYLAVVHPVIYLRLKKGGGVRIRNVSIGCAWLLSVGHCFILTFIHSDLLHVIFGCVFALFPLALVSFCSVSVLCVLIRPGPGQGGGDRKSIDQSKRAAFYTMTFILGALLLRFIALVAYHSIFLSLWYNIDDCVLTMCSLWFGLPSSLVLPLLFLHRAQAHRTLTV